MEFSPAGTNADGNYEIYWKDLVSGEVRQLTRTVGGDNVSAAAGANLWPRVSADGSRVVFVSNRSLDGTPVTPNRYGLFLADGSGNLRRLTAAEIEVAREFPAFGMDASGNRIVFSSDADLIGLNISHTPQIFAYDLNNSNVTQITRTPAGVTNSRPILSGDGLKMAFLSNGDFGGSNSNGVEQLWVYHFDVDAAYPDPFVQVTSLSGSQPATEGRISWADWYALDYVGSNLVFTCNADLVGGNSGYAYEVFLASIGWQPFRCTITAAGVGQYRLDWPALGSAFSYTVESCTSLVNRVWLPVLPDQWPISTTSWTNNVNPNEPARFFRVKAASSEWQSFRCTISGVGTSQYRLSWPVLGSSLYTVESCTALVNQV